MGTAKDFNRNLHKEIDVHAAWLPITNVFEVGDFGVISDGVFARMGNVRTDFGVQFETKAGPPAQLDFKSDDVREIRFVAGAEVGIFPGEDVEAKLTIEFKKGRSFYVKAKLDSQQVDSAFQLARQLVTKAGFDRRKFKVLSATYAADGCVILSSRKGGSTIEIGGKADALKQLELGKAELGLTFKSSSQLGLEIVGGRGIVGLRMFQVNGKGGVDFLRADRPPREGELQISESDQWDSDLEDDI